MFDNPYTYTEPVTGDMFFGRTSEMKDLLRGFRSREGDAFAIIGGRRIGKTSLLREIERRLLSEPNLHGIWRPIPVYLDLSLALPSSRRSFFASTTKVLLKRASAEPTNLDADRVNTEELFNEQRPDDDAVLDFESIIAQISSALSDSTRSVRVVLLFDAVDQILGATWVRELFQQLRALLSNRPFSRNLAMTMAGSGYLHREVQEEGSPLLNVMRRVIVLGILAEEQARQLSTQPLGAVGATDSFSPSIIERILSLTGGHPFLVQYLMWNLCELETEDVTERAVNSIANQFPNDRREFTDWFDEWNIVERVVYTSLIKSTEPLSMQDIVSKHIEDPRGVSRALYNLLATGTIKKTAGEGPPKYSPAGEMFKDWFTANYMRTYERLLLPDIQASRFQSNT